MADLTLRLDLRISPAAFRWGFAGLLLSCMASELSPESVTLSTYYPAPSGVYTQMITTTNAYLARDSGRVGVGITNPDAKLQVVGDGTGSARIGGGTGCGGDYTGISLNGQAFSGCGNYNILSSPSDQELYINRPSGKGMHFRENNGDQMLIATGGAVTVYGDLEVDGVVFAKNYGGCNGGSPTTYTAGVTTCPGGTYATLVSGVLAKYQVCGNDILPPPDQGTGTMLCCNCPTAGCPSF